MNNLSKKFTDILNNFPQLTAGKMLVAVSGGIDSVVLLHLLFTNRCQIEVVHCNFSLRGEESDGDEQFVKKLAEKYNIPCHVRKFETAKFAEENGISVQMAARQLRLEYFDVLFQQSHYSCICLAHHLNDNIETFFLNLLRGTGIRGLAGMKILSANLFRPLLLFTRNEIQAYADHHQLEYREDSSNRKDEYLRNKIRHHIIPQFISRFSGFTETMQENMARFEQGIALYEELIAQVRNEVFTVHSLTIFIDLNRLQSFANPVVLLGELINQYGFTFQHAEQMLNNSQQTETSRYESPTHIAFVKNRTAEIRPVSNFNPQYYEILSLADFANSELPIRISAEELIVSEITELKQDSSHAFLNADMVEFPLILRKWKQGDAFQPLGMKGTKLLSDFFTGLKLSEFQKQDVWILCAGDNILWIIGHRIDDCFKIKPETKKVLHLHIQ
jgi:tRNA(Ile)-lysidine synthase